MLVIAGAVYLGVLVAVCQAADPAPEGVRIYALTFMIANEGSTDAGYSSITVTSSENAASRIMIPNATVSEYELLRASNGWVQEYMTNSIVLYNQATEAITNRGVVVITKDTADVFGSRMIKATGDAYLALPLTVNGRFFYIPSYKSMLTGKSFYGIAAASTTCIEIYTVNNAGQYELLDSISLNQGDVYQKYSPDDTTDFTGIYISSAAAVSVFAGHECVQIPEGTQYCDHIVEQIPAVNFWGNVSIVPPVAGRLSGAGYTVRVLASQDTVITFPYNQNLIIYESGCACATGVTAAACTSTCQITKGKYVEVKVSDALAPITVVCSQPCLAVQYSHSLQAVANEPFDPDPYMTVVTPTDHYVNKMSYMTPYNQDANTGILAQYMNYLCLVVKTADAGGLYVDDNLVTDSGVTQGDYTIITQGIAHGRHVIKHLDPTKKVMAFALGHTPVTTAGTSSSYGHPVAYEIDDLSIAGSWADLIAVPPGYIDTDITTSVPRTCNTNATDVMYSSFTLRGVDTESMVSSCNSAMTVTSLTTLTDQINEAICDQIICADVAYDVFVTSLGSEIVDGTLHLTVNLANTMDAVFAGMQECRAHISNYLKQTTAWSTSSLSTDDTNMCSDVLFSLERIANEWDCPALNLNK